MSALMSALWITAVGMGLVFLGLGLIWGMMNLLVGLSASKSAPETVAEESPASQASAVSEQQRRRLAAALAVAYALRQAEDSMQPHEFPLPPTALVSAWQAVLRTRMVNKQRRTR